VKDNSNEEENERFLLPQLVPHPDKSYLIEFFTEGNDQCMLMEPYVKRLEEDLNTTVRVINLSKRPDLFAAFEAVGGNEVGAIPFFYNRRTVRGIFGATPYNNLKKLAMGRDHNTIEQVMTKETQQNMNVREFGIKGALKEKLLSKKNKDNSKKGK